MTDNRLPRRLRHRAADEQGRPFCADCRHLYVDHYLDRDGRPVCGGAACGCRGCRTVVPVAHRDEHDDSALPRLRYDHSDGAA